VSLPANQQHILDRMEGTLRASEPQLYSMFTMFARLNAAEPVRVEPLARSRSRSRQSRRPPRLRWLRAGTTIYAFVLVPVMFAMITIGALLSSRTHAGATCETGYAGGGLVSSRQWCHLTIQKTAASGARLAACAARIPVVTFVTRVGAQVLPPAPALAMAGSPAAC
jgi:hypothetical protein